MEIGISLIPVQYKLFNLKQDWKIPDYSLIRPIIPLTCNWTEKADQLERKYDFAF